MFNFFSLFGLPDKGPMSNAGRMLQHMADAEKRLDEEGITDELLCAIRRAEIKAMKEGKS